MSEGGARQAMRLVVTGRVQGVGFRAFTVRQGRALGLSGWVRNRTDGAVEILAVGAPAALDGLVAACRAGPPAARVQDVQREAAPGYDLPPGAGFTERPTAGVPAP